MKIVIVLGFSLISAAFCQTKSQQAGDCSVNIEGNGNSASLVCNGIDPKLAEQVRAILTSTRRNEKATKEIGEKLDLILKQMEVVPPEVALRFVYPKHPALVPMNKSAVVAKEIKWGVTLWNMDLPDRNDPLPIPVTIFDFIKPNGEGGPQNLFSSPGVASLLKPGDRLFGSVAVDCPECARGRTYVLFIVWDQGGWFSEVEYEKSGKVLTPTNFLQPTRLEYFKALEALVPVAARTPIPER